MKGLKVLVYRESVTMFEGVWRRMLILFEGVWRLILSDYLERISGGSLLQPPHYVAAQPSLSEDEGGGFGVRQQQVG